MINEETIRICKVVIDFGLYNIVQLSFFSNNRFNFLPYPHRFHATHLVAW